MKLIFATFIFISNLLFINADVPVFTWSNQLDLNLPQVFAGHSKSRDEFKRDYLDSDLSTILMFVQNEISISDILINGGIYGSNQGNNYEQLKSMMEKYISAYIPAVEKPMETILKVSDEKEFSFKKLSYGGLKGEGRLESEMSSLNFDKKNLIVVDFTDLIGSDQKKIDSMVGSIINHFKNSDKHFLAFYTAKHDNNGEAEVGSSENLRHLLGVEKEEEEPLYDGNFIIFFDSLSINRPNNSISLKSVSIIENHCSNINATDVPPALNCSVVLSCGSLTPYNDIQLDLTVATSGTVNQGYWYVNRVVMSYTVANYTHGRLRAVMLGGLTDATPLGLSYSCYEGLPLVSKSIVNSTNSESIKLYFKGLQVQAFAAHPPRFGYYNDCVGFFTTAIWMFLISAIILLSILLFGITMVMSINTMDRYDDPKGKTIIVANVD